MDQNEIDISPLVGLINTAINKSSAILQLLWKKKWLLVIAFLIGLSVFYFRHQQKTNIYSSSLIVSSPALHNEDAAQLIFEMKAYIHDENYTGLAKQMNSTEELVSKIRDIDYKGRFGEEFNSKKFPRRPEFYTIHIEYLEGTTLLKIQDGLRYYFNHHDYAMEKQFEAEQELHFKIILNKHQHRLVDSLIANIPEKYVYKNLIPQEQLAINSLMTEATILQLELSEFNKRLQELQKGTLQIVTPFIEQIHSKKRIDYKKMGLIAMSFPAFLSVLLIAFAKKEITQ